MKEQKSAGKGRPFLPQVLCGLALSFTMFVFAPVEMVTLNSVNFWFGAADFLPVFLLLFIAVFCVIEAVYCLLRKLPYPLWLLSLALLFGGTLCVYVQGTYLTMGSTALTTGDPVWREMMPRMLVNTAVWAAILLASTVLSFVKPKLFVKAVPAVCALILVMEGGTLAALMMNGGESGDVHRIYCSGEEEFTYSPNGDVIMVMIDTFDSRLMERALDEDPDYVRLLDDFTYYANTSSSSMLTNTSYMSFMTGQVADNQEPYFVYCRRALNESAFFRTMKDAGMTVHVYGGPRGAFGEEQLDEVDNLRVRNSVISSQTGFAKEMLCMVGYRYLPMAMQPFMLRDYVNGFAALQQMENAEYGEYVDHNVRFVERLREGGVTVDENRRFFKFHMLHGAHMPAQFGRHMKADEPMDQYEETLGCFALLGELFAQLREAGVYDKATIIVMGDHGVNDAQEYPGLCNPALLVKYPGETGPMRISNAPAALLDLRATALFGAGLDYTAFGTPVHQWEGVEQRDRRFLLYEYAVPYDFLFYLNDMTEYIVPADARDLAGYVPSGRVFKAAK